MLEQLKKEKKVVGIKQVIKSIENNVVRHVIIAKDADCKIIASINEACIQKGIYVKYADSMKQLGKACGIEVGSTAVSMLE